MAKTKKKVTVKRKKPAKWELEAYEYMDEGMKPYNAARKAGRNHSQAELWAGLENIKAMSGLDYVYYAEIIGYSPQKRIAHLLKMAGVFDREEGAQRVITAGDNNDFVEAPDDRTALAYLKEAHELMGLKKSDKELDAGKIAGLPNVTIQVLPPQDGTKTVVTVGGVNGAVDGKPT